MIPITVDRIVIIYLLPHRVLVLLVILPVVVLVVVVWRQATRGRTVNTCSLTLVMPLTVLLWGVINLVIYSLVCNAMSGPMYVVVVGEEEILASIIILIGHQTTPSNARGCVMVGPRHLIQ